jgi:hypothetical protein
MSGLGKVQKRILAAVEQGVVVLPLMEGSPRSLSRAARSLEKKGLVRVWQVKIRVRNAVPHKITVVGPPGLKQDHVAGLAARKIGRNMFRPQRIRKVSVYPELI